MTALAADVGLHRALAAGSVPKLPDGNDINFNIQQWMSTAGISLYRESLYGNLYVMPICDVLDRI
jgi:hypothetical protein